jgi:hypothetical protein
MEENYDVPAKKRIESKTKHTTGEGRSYVIVLDCGYHFRHDHVGEENE